MSWTKHHVLTINGGSSSIKFALYEIGSPLQQRLTGKIDRIGLSGTMLIFNDMTLDQQGSLSIDVCDYNSVSNFLLDWLEQHVDFTQVKAVGHRVVHGMQHAAPELVREMGWRSPYIGPAHAGPFSSLNISLFGQNESIIQLHS